MGEPSVKVLIASPLLSYTGADEVQARGATLGAVLDDLEARYPGIRFRMVDEQDQLRRHMRFFVNGEIVKSLSHPIRAGDELGIVQALSGGSGATGGAQRRRANRSSGSI